MGDLSRPVRGNCGAMRELRGDAVVTSPGLKPKKVWAKKRFVDTKADKAKKRA